ncbi:hypothetical protein VNO80_02174 [Phaseolus coccineus]|uniref:CTLH domain-containing protein n=1 Tax=Phaseolus coccineus TaxID=3886 RepID=A0AAN9RRG5_PHACN
MNLNFSSPIISPNRRFQVPTMVDPKHYEQIAINEQVVNNIILSYLTHNCYGESSEAFIACTGMNRPADHLENTQKRKSRFIVVFHKFLSSLGIVNSALEGDTLKAIELTEELSHDILDNNKDLLFDLLSLHFVGLVCSKKWSEAVEFAQTNLGPFGRHPIYTERVEDFMSLLAFKNTLESPMVHLTTTGYRQQVVDTLNRTLLAYFNLPSRSTMERLIQQTTLVREGLRRTKGFPPFSLRIFLRR